MAAVKRIHWLHVSLIVVVIAALFLAGIVVWRDQTAVDTQFIVVTGISSAGKSSSVDALKKMLGSDCAVVRLDDYIQKIIEAKARQLSWNEQSPVGPMEFLRTHCGQDLGHAVFDYEIRANLLDYSFFYDAIRAAGRENRYVLVDTVVESSRCHEELQSVVGSKTAFWVLLYCPLQIIEHRLQVRQNMGSFANHGISLATYESFLAMFTRTKGAHWTAIDSLHPHDTRMLLDASINNVLVPVPYDKLMAYKERLNVFRKRFLEHFCLDNQHHSLVPIYPTERYNLVLNSGTTPCEVIAQEIKQGAKAGI